MLASAGAASTDALSFCAADLLSDAGWPAAVAGCGHVLHVASPFPIGVPKHEDELIRPARDGALRVLKAARDAGVRRVVDWLVRLVAVFDPSIRQIVPELGRIKNASHDKATRLLGWKPRSNDGSVLATAESLLRLGLIRGSGK
jgi:hypothetical protein